MSGKALIADKAIEKSGYYKNQDSGYMWRMQAASDRGGAHRQLLGPGGMFYFLTLVVDTPYNSLSYIFILSGFPHVSFNFIILRPK